MKKNSGGFAIIELMIVVILLGILAAIFIPMFVSLADRDRQIKDDLVILNMQIMQGAVEEIARTNDGLYPLFNEWREFDHVRELCPDQKWPVNPYAGFEYPLIVGSDDSNFVAGDIVYTVDDKNCYTITGYGAKGKKLNQQLSNCAKNPEISWKLDVPDWFVGNMTIEGNTLIIKTHTKIDSLACRDARLVVINK